MTTQENNPAGAASPQKDAILQTVREQAEAAERDTVAQRPDDSERSSPEETRRLLHELRVHQIELELQNEELRRSQVELDIERARYVDLYDLAPVGSCSVDATGLILEANLTASTLLGVAHGALITQPISRFIAKDNQDVYDLHRRQFTETGESQEVELRMVTNDGTQFWAHLTTAVAQDEGGALVCRIVMSDVTTRKKAEAECARLGAQLRESQKLEARGRLAEGVAHDINNALALIMGNVALARDYVGSGHMALQSLEDIDVASSMIQDLTKQLMRDTPAVLVPLPKVAALASDTVPVHEGGKHVLYVDDDQALVVLMSRMLEIRGYRVSAYTDARDALAAVRANPYDFDLVVTDYNMLSMSGLEVAHALHELRTDLPVVVLSGYITDELHVKMAAAGVRELLHKPFAMDVLCGALERHTLPMR